MEIFKEAFQEREEDDANYVNSHDWRNGRNSFSKRTRDRRKFGKALYGILSNGCDQGWGISIMSEASLQQAITPHSSGPDSVLFGAPIKFGLGYELAQGIAESGKYCSNTQQ